MSDQPENPETEPVSVTDLAFRMGLSLGRIEGLLDGMVSRLDRRHGEVTRALDARIAAEADTEEGK